MAWSFLGIVVVSAILVLSHVSYVESRGGGSEKYVSVLGDPGMKSSDVRVGFEAWNFCNEVGAEAPTMASPRIADCTDLDCPSFISDSLGHKFGQKATSECKVHQRVNESDNALKSGEEFPVSGFKPHTDPDLYAVEKELYLGSLCEKDDWQFWMIMLKNGNFDKNTTLCPDNGKKLAKIVTDRTFPCFGTGCMNQPLVYQNYSRLVSSPDGSSYLTGGFYGTYDLDTDLSRGGFGKSSYFSVTWEKSSKTGSWVFSHKLTTSKDYPWLMLYLRSDATRGFNGGYHYPGRGIMKKLPESPKFKVRLRLDVKRGGGQNSQFYLLDIGSCWKNDGRACDGDVVTDVTRYSEMIINPATRAWCRADNLVSCPPRHVSASGEIIHRNDTARFPYSAYHLYCAPGNALHLDKPFDLCDPYSNPQPQELLQILPHPEWAPHGYPSRQGQGWVGDPTSWDLDVGALSSRLYFYQDPGTEPAKRVWTSLNVGTEIYVSRNGETAEWTVSDFDVLVPEDPDTTVG